MNNLFNNLKTIGLATEREYNTKHAMTTLLTFMTNIYGLKKKDIKTDVALDFRGDMKAIVPVNLVDKNINSVPTLEIDYSHTAFRNKTMKADKELLGIVAVIIGFMQGANTNEVMKAHGRTTAKQNAMFKKLGVSTRNSKSGKAEFVIDDKVYTTIVETFEGNTEVKKIFTQALKDIRSLPYTKKSDVNTSKTKGTKQAKAKADKTRKEQKKANTIKGMPFFCSSECVLTINKVTRVIDPKNFDNIAKEKCGSCGETYSITQALKPIEATPLFKEFVNSIN